MLRRTLLQAVAGVGLSSLVKAVPKPFALGINTYCLRALRWHDARLLDYAASLKMDAVFLQDSLDPGVMDPAHWREVRDQAQRLGLHIETGGGAILPRQGFDEVAAVAMLRKNIDRAKAIGSPLVRCLLASERAVLPPGPEEKHLETGARILRAVRSQALDAGVKMAVEVHKDFHAFQFRQLMEATRTDFAGIYLDTGNPVFTLEDPMTTVEELGPYALTVHLRDSVVYEHPRGAAVQWVPLGEGVVDFPSIVARLRDLCPSVYVYIKPITGRPPQVLPYLEPGFWKLFPSARAKDLARFLRLARNGHPYEGHVVIEDLQGRQPPPQFLEAIQFQQKEHMERSVEYGKQKLDLGVRWRNA